MDSMQLRKRNAKTNQNTAQAQGSGQSMSPPEFKPTAGPEVKANAGGQTQQNSGPMLIAQSGAPIVDSTKEAWDHYFDGNGEAVDIGPNTTSALLNGDQFQYYHNRIIGGETTALNGNFSVSMTYDVFHIGRTNILYDIQVNGEDCIVTYTLYADDGFWDPNFLLEDGNGSSSYDYATYGGSSSGSSSGGNSSFGSSGSGRSSGESESTGWRSADGVGPNLELPGGTPYAYNTTTMRYAFKASEYQHL